MKKIVVLIVSLFFAGFSFCQVNNIGGGSTVIEGDSSWIKITVDSITGASGKTTFADTLEISGYFEYNPPHGSFAFADSSVTLDMSTNTWVQVANPTGNLFIINDTMGITFQNDSIVIQCAGDYIVIASVSFSGSAGDAYEFAFFENGVINGAKMERTTSQTDVGNLGLPTYLEGLEAGDGITLKIRNTASNDDATLISCSWIIWLLHS